MLFSTGTILTEMREFVKRTEQILNRKISRRERKILKINAFLPAISSVNIGVNTGNRTCSN